MTNNMDDMVRALVAYGDTVDLTGIQLLMNAHDDTATAVRTREIISEIKGMPMTDSDVDDLTDYIDDQDDTWNE